MSIKIPSNLQINLSMLASFKKHLRRVDFYVKISTFFSIALLCRDYINNCLVGYEI